MKSILFLLLCVNGWSQTVRQNGGGRANQDTNIFGGSSGDIPYQSAANTTSFDTGQLYWDATNNRLGIGIGAPATSLHVFGNAQFGNTVAVSTMASNGDIQAGADAYFSLVLSTQAAGAAGTLVTKTCPSGTYALSGGCSCSGTAVGTVTGIINMPNPTITAAGTMPTGWQCQSADSTTGQACAVFVICSRIRF